jgi:hypothetical protein
MCLEDREDYKSFETAVASDFDVRTAVERELVLRLASLLWRLRRATAIDTGLLQILSDIDEGSDPKIPEHANEASIGRFAHVLHDQEKEQIAEQHDLTLNSDLRAISATRARGCRAAWTL